MQASFWAILGLLLVTLEIFTGTFVLLFFGIGGLLTALVKWLNLFDNLALEILTFSFLSLLNLFLFRRRIGKSLQLNTHFSKEQEVTLETSFGPQEKKSITYQGSPWQAINTSTQTLNAGDSVIIEKIEGVTLHLKPKEKKND